MVLVILSDLTGMAQPLLFQMPTPQHMPNNTTARMAGILIPNNEVTLRNMAHKAVEKPNETISFAEKSSFFRKDEKDSSKKPGPANKINPAASRTHERMEICSRVI